MNAPGDKAPFVRLLDVVLVGPFCVVAGARLMAPGPRQALGLGAFVAATGVATILYNYRNLDANLREVEGES